jgi:hypothetical protein
MLLGQVRHLLVRLELLLQVHLLLYRLLQQCLLVPISHLLHLSRLQFRLQISLHYAILQRHQY